MMLKPEEIDLYRAETGKGRLFTSVTVRVLLGHIDAQQARIDEWEALGDPNTLHVNLLRGIPAKLSDDQLLHIAGDKYQAMAARIFDLELALFAENQKRQEVALACDKMLVAVRGIVKLADDHFNYGGSRVLRTANNCIAEMQKLASEAIAFEAAQSALCEACGGTGIDVSFGDADDGDTVEVACQACATKQPATTQPVPAPDAAKEYCWSNDGENYHGSFASPSEALDDYLSTHDVADAAQVRIGEAKHHTPGNPVYLADDVLEQLNCQASDEAGEWAGEWPDLSKGERQELGQMIQDFVWKHDAPTFYTVENAVLYDVATRQPVAAQKP